MQLGSQYIPVFLVGSILYFIYNILQTWYIPLKLCQLREWAEQPASCPSAPSALAHSMLRIHLVSLRKLEKGKKSLYVCTSASFITKAGLKINRSNFVDVLVFSRNHFLWDGASKEFQSSCCLSSNELCWIYGNSGPGCPTQCFSLVGAIWHSLFLQLMLMVGTAMSDWSTSTPNPANVHSKTILSGSGCLITVLRVVLPVFKYISSADSQICWFSVESSALGSDATSLGQPWKFRLKSFEQNIY